MFLHQFCPDFSLKILPIYELATPIFTNNRLKFMVLYLIGPLWAGWPTARSPSKASESDISFGQVGQQAWQAYPLE